jgi:hypothetical protein
LEFRCEGLEIKPDVGATLQWWQQRPKVEAITPAGVTGVLHKVDAVLKGGLRYLALQTSTANVRRGETIGLNFDFQFDRPDLDLFNLVVYVHFVNAAGVTVFQGDFCLAELLSLKESRRASPSPWRQSIAVPANAAPGVYTIRTGLYYLTSLDRLRVASCPHPVKVKAVYLPGELRVVE